ncbi:cobyric acid synthase [Metabacillus arenae]|uniref:Cobyric acid synthase n=1 Tax=Metabacillus arenae TaxID=2771434 RepID=A0A926RW07_9BACI|nr:cobyric acid synthase [Metabacillus arenae]MBD1378707.1 cobyric acid synthase [Metabacillus arenae]
MKGIMLQGTSSDVGKSLLATALCRIFFQLGYRTAPFKSQNMSNNSYVTKDGREIGRAQGLQAEAANIEASVYMNPILLKPRSDMQSEVVLFGKSDGSLNGREYREGYYEKGLSAIGLSLEKLAESCDLIVIEGAGSPVEINLNDRELVNMKIAELANVPVVLIADIERGGVFASIIGTLELLSESEKSRVKGIIINKFRGDLSLFQDGVEWLECRTGIKVLGVIPYVEHQIEGEDSLSLRQRLQWKDAKPIDIGVIKLSYLSNYTDIEPFLYEDDVSVRIIDQAESFGHPDALIIPGTRSTIRDLQSIKESGLAEKVINYAKTGGVIVGLCGGYQMLSITLLDESGSDTDHKGLLEKGLGILPVHTIFEREKTTIRRKAIVNNKSGFPPIRLSGFEIHLGKTSNEPNAPGSSFLLSEDQYEEVDGWAVENGRIIGTYFHHLFHNDEWRCEWLNRIRIQKGLTSKTIKPIEKTKSEKYDMLAEHVKKHVNIEALLSIINEWKTEKNE